MRRAPITLGCVLALAALGAGACGGQNALPEDAGTVGPSDAGGAVDTLPPTEDANEEFVTVPDASADAPDAADALDAPPPAVCPAGGEVEDGSIVPPPRPCDAGMDAHIH
jgi:hypothetical protein